MVGHGCLSVHAGAWLIVVLCSPIAASYNSTCRHLKVRQLTLLFCSHLAGLLQQVIQAASDVCVPLSGENALQRYDSYAFDRIAESAFGLNARAGRLEQLTFLRMGDLMFDNWDAFTHFLRVGPCCCRCILFGRVSAHYDGGRTRCWVPNAATALYVGVALTTCCGSS